MMHPNDLADLERARTGQVDWEPEPKRKLPLIPIPSKVPPTVKYVKDSLGRNVRIKEGMTHKSIRVRVISPFPPEGLLVHDQISVFINIVNRIYKGGDYYRFEDAIESILVRFQECRKCDGTGEWLGTHVTRACFGCDGTGVISRAADRYFPIGSHDRVKSMALNRLCEVCSEPNAPAGNRLCGTCRRSLWADKTDWTPEHGDLIPELTSPSLPDEEHTDHVERECRCERGTRQLWLDAERVCLECWTDAYMPQVTMPFRETKRCSVCRSAHHTKRTCSKVESSAA